MTYFLNSVVNLREIMAYFLNSVVNLREIMAYFHFDGVVNLREVVDVLNDNVHLLHHIAAFHFI